MAPEKYYSLKNLAGAGSTDRTRGQVRSTHTYDPVSTGASQCRHCQRCNNGPGTNPVPGPSIKEGRGPHHHEDLR